MDLLRDAVTGVPCNESVNRLIVNWVILFKSSGYDLHNFKKFFFDNFKIILSRSVYTLAERGKSDKSAISPIIAPSCNSP